MTSERFFCNRQSIRHDGPDGGFRVGFGEQLVANESPVARLLQGGEHRRIINFPGARLVTARRVRHVDVAELVGIGADMVAQAALVELHVVHIVQHLQVRGADEPGQFGGRAGMAEEIAGMVRGDSGSRLIRTPQVSAHSAAIFSVSNMVQSFTASLRSS